VTRTANGIVVEFEAELPEDFQRTTTDQFGIGDFDEEGGLEDSQLDLEEEPTEERERAARASAAQAAADASIGPTIDDALLGLEAHEPDQPHVAELPLEPIAEDVSPPPHAPPVVLLHAPPRADAPAGPAIGSPSRSGPITFEHELTPLPEPYDPEAADEDPSLDARRTTPASVRDAEEAPGTPPPPDSPAGRVHAHLAEARKQFDRGDLVAAACAAEAAFTCDPQNVAAATREAERQLLIRIFETQLGSLRRVPKVLMTPPEIARLGLDHRFGFLLDRIDGATSFDDLLDIAGMPRLEAYRILEALVRKGVISA